MEHMGGLVQTFFISTSKCSEHFAMAVKQILNYCTILVLIWMLQCLWFHQSINLLKHFWQTSVCLLKKDTATFNSPPPPRVLDLTQSLISSGALPRRYFTKNAWLRRSNFPSMRLSVRLSHPVHFHVSLLPFSGISVPSLHVPCSICQCLIHSSRET